MNVMQVRNVILAKSKSDDFAGYDPFDGLNSKLFDIFPSFKNNVIGLAWIQFFKRSSVNFRPVCSVPKKRNPKGIGLFILGMLEQHQQSNEAELLNLCIELADWLIEQQCDKQQWQHSCWGYHFDWKARAFFVPKGKPNVITTIYVAQALWKLADVLEQQDKHKSEQYRNLALDAGSFIVETLYTEADNRCFFAYIPGETAFVHNASLWAAAWVSVVASYTNNQSYRELALKVARQSVAEQAADGSWVYGARHHHQFIDGFHTGYNLEALHLIRSSLQIDEFDDAIKRGFSYYKENLFEADGTAKYYHNDRYPLDPHSVSQAIITLVKLAQHESDIRLAEKVIFCAIDTLYLPEKKQFIYQKSKRSVNKINYMRWTQAWMFYSLSFYLNVKGSVNEAH
ncbi:aspartate-semialdehyde dehydrogenase [Vibrio sp. IRLE0018]|uniref:aspartate-semialdehyde dehydrogenase n=1 Tax=Vibrio floridensis TaxID=2908007 RepID=UPI001F1AE1F3|nr:aspartate-semialdehyde dehydrogenase [Vibrio floridensis]MCF8780050.1 aspartate-semialdehyde dehydrogenase [Vibrio floridensis]